VERDRRAGAAERIVQLLAVARGLEDEGQYNIAKLFRAAAFGEGAAAARTRPRGSSALQRAAYAALDELREAGGDNDLTDAMEHGLGHLRAGEWTTLEDAPRTFVCRACGVAQLGAAPARCESCGARPLTLQEFPPIHYLEPLTPEEIIRTLAEGLVEVERLTAGVTDEQAARGSWALRDILGHLAGADELLVGRVRRTLTEDDPLLISVDPATIVEDTPDMDGLRAAFGAARRATLALCASLTPEQWARRGQHPEWGWLTVQTQLGYLARHEQTHLAELEDRRLGR
jgi:rubrerythrin